MLAGFWLSCSPKEKPNTKGSAKKEPYVLEFEDTVTIDQYEGSNLAWVLKTTYLTKAEKTGKLFVKPLRMVFYDSLGKESAHIKSDSGAADENISFVSVWGNVYAESSDGMLVEADSLIWKKNTKRIETEGWVKVVTEDKDTLTGVGFTSDDRLKNWKILSDIRTVIQKVENRVNESEEKEEP